MQIAVIIGIGMSAPVTAPARHRSTQTLIDLGFCAVGAHTEAERMQLRTDGGKILGVFRIFLYKAVVTASVHDDTLTETVLECPIDRTGTDHRQHAVFGEGNRQKLRRFLHARTDALFHGFPSVFHERATERFDLKRKCFHKNRLHLCYNFGKPLFVRFPLAFSYSGKFPI